MADASFTYDSQGAEKVVQSNQRVEKSMNKLGRGGKNAGMAILEASRGFEDFAVAGVRGVINNVPGVMMSLGVGMGLTGALSAVTVAVWKGVEALDNYLSRMRDIQLAKFENLGITKIDPDAIGAAFNAEAVKRAEKMKGVMEGMADAMGMVESVSRNAESIRKEQMALSNAETMLQLAKENASEETKRFQALVNSYQTEDDALNVAKEKLKVQEEYMALLKASRQGQMQEIGKMKVDEIDRMNKILRKMELDENKALIARGISPEQAGIRAKQRVQTAMRFRIENAFGSVKAFEEAARNREVARENLKIIDEQINKSQMLLDKEKDSVKAQEQITELRKKRLTVENQIASAEQRLKDEEKQRELENRAMQERIDTSNMLSTQGRSGLAGNEIRAAMETLNFAKKSFQALKEIANNTRKFRATYA